MPKPASGKYTITGTKNAENIDGRTYPLDLQDRGLSINGAGGDDTLRGGRGPDVLNGGNGNDTLIADMSDLLGIANNTLVYQGGNGSDTLDLRQLTFSDGTGLWVRSGGGMTWIATDFVMTGGPAGTNWTWGARWDNCFSSVENFRLGNGNDHIQLITGAGWNSVWAGAGDDWVEAGDGNDTLFGEDGNDVLSHGWGNDVMTGGDGNDAFLLAGRLVGEYTYDRVTDFDLRTDENDASYDQIWLLAGWTLTWDASSTDVLRGHFYDPAFGTIFGEIILDGLTSADAGKVQIVSYDPAIGPLI